MLQINKLKELKQDKGVAGLTLFLSLITFLFVIGLLVMIFALMGGELEEATYDSTAVAVINESGGWINITNFTVDNAGVRDFSAFVVTAVYNNTDGELIAVGNYTADATGTLVNASATNYADVNISYTYVWNADNDATDIMNASVNAIGGSTDWFPIFVVIGAMVVLILLTVIIIVAIRGSGLMGNAGASGSGGRNEGSA